MPELPEVEIVRQSLNKKIRLKNVKKVIIRNNHFQINGKLGILKIDQL